VTAPAHAPAADRRLPRTPQAAYREPGKKHGNKKHGKAMMQAVIDSVASSVPATLTEIRTLGLTGPAAG
jgi:hypothetical protein